MATRLRMLIDKIKDEKFWIGLIEWTSKAFAEQRKTIIVVNRFYCGGGVSLSRE